jgi:hypothetical protein
MTSNNHFGFLFIFINFSELISLLAQGFVGYNFMDAFAGFRVTFKETVKDDASEDDTVIFIKLFLAGFVLIVIFLMTFWQPKLKWVETRHHYHCCHHRQHRHH